MEDYVRDVAKGIYRQLSEIALLNDTTALNFSVFIGTHEDESRIKRIYKVYSCHEIAEYKRIPEIMQLLYDLMGRRVTKDMADKWVNESIDNKKNIIINYLDSRPF